VQEIEDGLAVYDFVVPLEKTVDVPSIHPSAPTQFETHLFMLMGQYGGDK
jgi:hypothetical protein